MKVVDFLKQMGTPEFLQSIGLYGFRLLKPENDPTQIHWSVVLYERGEDGNRLRVQADNINAKAKIESDKIIENASKQTEF
jgi:hypothetical protein